MDTLRVTTLLLFLSLAPTLRAGANPQISSAPARSTPTGQALIDAVKARDLERVKALLAAGAPLDVRDRRGNTPILLAAAQRPPRTKPRESVYLDREPNNPLLRELLMAATRRKTPKANLDLVVDGQGRVGGSFIAWLEGEGSLRVFGRGGGLLLDTYSPLPPRPRLKDVDGDGRNELIVQSGSRGTGLYHSFELVYFFDDRQFADPLSATTYSYTDSTWFGFLRRGQEQFLIPPISSNGRITFRDTDGDGIKDLAEAVERRWFGSQDDSGHASLEDGPAWANAKLRKCFDLTLGRVQTKVVTRWRRHATQPIFVLEPAR